MNDLTKGIVLDMKRGFGDFKFCGLGEERTRSERRNGRNAIMVVERDYNLCCTEQKGNIPVTLPGTVGLKKFPPLAKVKLVNPVVHKMNNAINGVGYTTYGITADDIVEAE